VYVENSGFGATYAAPIASLLVEKYLKGEIDKSREWVEKRMLDIDLIHSKQEN
jgi:penicillin-binding protein 2